MVIRKRIFVAAISVLSVLWLLFLVSNFSSTSWNEIFSSFGGQRSYENSEELTGITNIWTPKQPLEVFTEIAQSSPEIPGPEMLSNGYPDVLILSPLKQVSGHIKSYFTLLHSLSYPKNSISLGFLVSDSDDRSYDLVRDHFLQRKKVVTNQTEKYRDVTLVHQSFSYNPGSNWVDIHGMRNQIPRRKVLAKSRNYLLFSSLRPHHEWVLWIDSDVSHYPPTMVQDLLNFTGPDKHILVPNSYWRDDKGEEHPYDRNSWRETPESRKFLKQTQEIVVFEGYSAYTTGRISLGDLRGSNESVVKLDAVGGTVLLVRGRLHREGLVFLPVPYEKAIETEALGKLALGMGYQPWGLPNYITIH
ncbi:hypothetical protein KC19_11G126500 [Ceratodon purpureus]|uniref:Mannan polymerase II complex ANP1 subunit n=1 Tax=Ceratodon purpureus TaxID=3225 RepID=A0A8T0GI05_CERPU|nr:hypothetical protein KC19_11G126500 [Ceratodon purpureus]